LGYILKIIKDDDLKESMKLRLLINKLFADLKEEFDFTHIIKEMDKEGYVICRKEKI
jgi:hypothetical protein